MYKRLILLVVILLFNNILNGQARTNKDSLSILIYAEGETFLQPYIETTIKNLINKNLKKKYFQKANSFNRFVSENKYQAELSDLIGTITPENKELNVGYTEQENLIRKRIFKILREYQYFLSVKTNTLGELIEFQFQLYETVSSKESGSYNISDKVIGVQNFFIDPKSSDYLKKVKNAIEKLFLNSNKIPETILSINDKRIKTGDSILLPLHEVILFDGSNSGDYDSEIINYEWRNIPDSDETFQTFDKLNFKQGERQQFININKSGPYKIGFKVYDGVSYSNEIIFKVNTVKKPRKLKILDSTIYSYHKLSLFNLNPKLLHSGSLYIDTKGNVEEELKKIFIVNDKIQDQFIESENIDFVPLEEYNENNVSKLDVISEFPAPEISRKNEIYLYSLGDDNVLSEPVKVSHELVFKSAFNVHLNWGPIVLNSKGESLKTEDGIPLNRNNEDVAVGETFLDVNLGIGLLLNENVEFGVSVGFVNSQKAYYKDYIINLSSNINTWLSYSLITTGSFEPNIGMGLNNYRFKEIEKDMENTLSVSGFLGVNYKLYNNNKSSCMLKIDYAYGKFIERKFLDLYTHKLRLGTVFRF
jgi:hypothetical protein